MSARALDILHRIIRYNTITFFFLFPLFYLPITPDSYEYNKQVLLIIFDLVMMVLFFLKWILEKKIPLTKNTFFLPLLLITIMSVVSMVFAAPNVVVALTTPLSTTTHIASFILYMILLGAVASHDKERYLAILIIDGCLISLYTLLLYAGLLSKGVYTPAGSIYATAIFLGIISVYIITRIMAIKNSDSDEDFSGEKIFYIATLILTGGTTAFLSYKLLTSQIPVILPFQFGWAILMEIFKDIKTMVMGVGPVNFMTAFTLAKPLGFNTSAVWNIVFTNSSSYLLTLGTEIGVLALGAFIYIIAKTIRLLYVATVDSPLTAFNPKLTYIIPLLCALLVQAALPTSMVVIILTIVFLSFAAYTDTTHSISLKNLKQASFSLLIVPILLIVLVGYFGGRAYYAEVAFKRSLDSLLNNQGKDTYDYQRKAIALNPSIDRYRVAFSQTNLALANSIAGNKEASEEDKQKIPTLVQQSIDEARMGVALYKTNLINWDNLGAVYTSIINFAEGSAEWAVKSYEQKIILDPNGPSSRMSLGGLYLQLRKFPEAETAFRQALVLKPDFANAHFNLAVALRQQGKVEEAKKALENARTLLPPDSQDLKKIEGELQNLTPQAQQQEPAFWEDSTVTTTPTPTPRSRAKATPTFVVPPPVQ